jgi:hypothetical protein
MSMPLSDHHKRHRARNYAVGAVLIGLVVLFYVLTMVRMGGA